MGNVAHPHPVGLGRARLVQEQIRGAPPAVGRIGGARGEGLGLQGPPLVPAQARAQGLEAHPVAFFPQFDLQAPGAVAAFVVVEHDEHLRFPGRFGCPHGPGCRSVPLGVVAAGHHAQELV